MNSIRTWLAGTLVAAGALTAAASLSIATAADAPPPPPAAAPDWRGPGSHHGPGGPEHLFRQLNLTAEQQASIKSIMTTAHPQMKTEHEQMHANHLKLMQTQPDDPNYAAVVAEVSQSNAMLASQRTTQMADVRAQMYAVLTPAQKAQLKTLEAQRLANPPKGRWGHHGHGPDMGGPGPGPDGE